jgi:hypothetical protein
MSIHQTLNNQWWNNFMGNATPSKMKYTEVSVPEKKAPVQNNTIQLATTHISEYTNFGKEYRLPSDAVTRIRNAGLGNTTMAERGESKEATEETEETEQERINAIITRLNQPGFDNTIPAEKEAGESFITDPALIEHVNGIYNDYTRGLVKTSKAPGGRGGGGGHGSKLEIKIGGLYVPLADAGERDLDTLHEIYGGLLQLKQAAEGKVKEKINRDLKKINEKLKKISKEDAGGAMVGGGGGGP